MYRYYCNFYINITVFSTHEFHHCSPYNCKITICQVLRLSCLELWYVKSGLNLKNKKITLFAVLLLERRSLLNVKTKFSGRNNNTFFYIVLIISLKTSKRKAVKYFKYLRKSVLLINIIISNIKNYFRNSTLRNFNALT